MYVFGMLIFLALAALAASKVVDRYAGITKELSLLVLIAAGMGTAWLAGFDLWGAWGLAIRNHTIAVTTTGFAIGGVAYFWREVLDFFGGLTRKFRDQAATLEKSEGLRRVA